ncbi:MULTISPECIES: hypothetical protein [unclassified Pseudomonas]|uniref:hypothetical protein n=1 Tax=unclassified Pseudomonas TaxID=196821 RepID=UPI00244ACC96|nr:MULTISPECIES: hypothetical protein [unclassified Pseudomonas]MDH0892900.1 hypothetical protein [Pseudomonas sp. GD03875]MDH1064626.1 hypothetical protein [Pseudomonas sp. GD03985]
MAIYLITYDLNNPGQKHNQVLTAIKEFPAWARLSESSYAVDSTSTSKQIFDYLAVHIDKNDTLLVITLSLPYYGQASKEVIDWLSNGLK